MATQPLFGNPNAKARIWSQFAVLLGGLDADDPATNAAFTRNDPDAGSPILDQWDPVGALADDTPFDDGSENITVTPHSAAGFGVYGLSFGDQTETIAFTAKETTLTTLGILYDVSDLEEAAGAISGNLAQRDPSKKFKAAFHRQNADECERYITANYAQIESISRSFGNKESLRTVTLRIMADPTTESAAGRPLVWKYYLGPKA